MLKSLALSLSLSLCTASAFAAPTASAPTTSTTTTPTPSTGKVTVQKPEAPPTDGRLERDVVPTHQAIWLRLVPGNEAYGGSVDIDVDVQNPKKTIWLHARGLEVTRAVARFGGKAIDGSFAIVDDVDGLAALRLPAAVSGKGTLHLEFTSTLHDDLNALYRVKAGPSPDQQDWYVFSQFEALAAREAFPCFDEPGFKIPFDVSVTHLGSDTAIANTAVVKEDTIGKEKKTTFATTKKLPTYCWPSSSAPSTSLSAPSSPPPSTAKSRCPFAPSP